MVIGHLGVALVARARWPRVPLALLAAASVAPDFVDLALAALHVCAPAGIYSHSLPAAGLIAIVWGSAAALALRSRGAGAVVAAVVLLHLPADYVTGFKVFWPGSPAIGLGLYSYPLADFVLEALIAFAGWWILRAAPASPRWAVRPLFFVCMLAAQLTLDAASYYAGPIKPNGCVARRWTVRAAHHDAAGPASLTKG